MYSQPDSGSDVKIIVGSEPNIKEFNVHSSVLRSCSPYFQRALSERWKDKKHGVYIITKPNIHPNIFMLILDFIFSFTDPSNPILSRVKTESKNKAICNNELYGPYFGESDLYMKESNRWTSNWRTYEHNITYSSQLIAEEYEILAFDNYNPVIINIFLKILRMITCLKIAVIEIVVE
ncbi:12688_t:CDS:2 [Dentiscutata heterogama]|uniref:12688_t:CDS:1 n=1 Tax=Dentiscutata heterogama TaxID=1316150 RepID=A0ACA9KTL8_9GLOM|nr:12688_t:CDS:2 [Dentiscutata heterogama]